MANYIDRDAAIAALCAVPLTYPSNAGFPAWAYPKNGWFSTEIALPEEEMDVLLLVECLTRYGENLQYRHTYRDIYTGYLQDGEWYTYYCHGYKSLGDTEAENDFLNETYTITHWMPLPEMPGTKTMKG